MINQPRNIVDMLEILETKDPATYAHSIRVSEIALQIALEMGMEDQHVLRNISVAALLHDIGKVFVPDEILFKKGGLNVAEFKVMKKHVAMGKIITSQLDDFEIRMIVFQHHEAFDGSGYPMRLKADEICIGAKICATADAFDVIRFGRHYREARSAEQTVAEIERCSGTKFAPDVVVALNRCATKIEKILARNNFHAKNVIAKIRDEMS